jgi:hypothetical protein
MQHMQAWPAECNAPDADSPDAMPYCAVTSTGTAAGDGAVNRDSLCKRFVVEPDGT